MKIAFVLNRKAEQSAKKTQFETKIKKFSYTGLYKRDYCLQKKEKSSYITPQVKYRESSVQNMGIY